MIGAFGHNLGTVGQSGVTPFVFGNALLFNGVNDYVINSSGAGCSCSADFTVGLWVKRNNLTSPQFPRMVDFSDGTNNFQLTFGGNGANNNIVHTKNTAYQGGLTSTKHGTALNISTWYCIVVSYTHTGNVMNVYIDGALAPSSAGETTGATNLTGTALNLGRRNDGNAVTFLNGVLDEVGIKSGYAATLTDAQNFYNGGSGQYFDTVFASPNVYYKLDETGTATTAVDSSGNGRDGTLTNFPASGQWVAH